jgi:hypothetical protein
VRAALGADLRRTVPPRSAGPLLWRLEILVKCLVQPRVEALVLYRLAQPLARRGWHGLAHVLQGRMIRRTGADISPMADIGPGLLIMHSVGIVIGPDVCAGRDLTLYQNVTLGDGSGRGSRRSVTPSRWVRGRPCWDRSPSATRPGGSERRRHQGRAGPVRRHWDPGGAPRAP